jgi:hypothetical protein
MDGTVAKVISPSVPVQDVTVNGQSVLDGTTAKVLVPAPPVTDVKVNNQSVVNQGVADINITPPPVTDVQLNGQSVLTGSIANIAPKASDVAINPAITGMNATNCQEGFSELKGTLDDVEGMLVSYILNYDLATNRFPLTDSMKAPLGNAQLTLVVRNAQTGALHVIWYNSSERKFVLASTLSGSAPSDGNSINVQYIALN